MKVERKSSSFRPVLITLECQEDVDALKRICFYNSTVSNAIRDELGAGQVMTPKQVRQETADVSRFLLRLFQLLDKLS